MLYKFGDFVLDPERLVLSRDGLPQKIEPQIYALLELLVTHANTVISKEEIIQTVWNGRHISDATINSRVHAARAAIDDNGTGETDAMSGEGVIVGYGKGEAPVH